MHFQSMRKIHVQDGGKSERLKSFTRQVCVCAAHTNLILCTKPRKRGFKQRRNEDKNEQDMFF
jgi:hypothetical protein